MCDCVTVWRMEEAEVKTRCSAEGKGRCRYHDKVAAGLLTPYVVDGDKNVQIHVEGGGEVLWVNPSSS